MLSQPISISKMGLGDRQSMSSSNPRVKKLSRKTQFHCQVWRAIPPQKLTIFLDILLQQVERDCGHCRRYFHIASDMHNKVMDISGGSSSPGAHVIAWPKKADGSARNQLWYFDGNGIILSALNDFALTSKS